MTSHQPLGMAHGATAGSLPYGPIMHRTSRRGYDAWAVQVQRSDGSVVTGFVDPGSGAIVDWLVHPESPVAAPNTPHVPTSRTQREEQPR